MDIKRRQGLLLPFNHLDGQLLMEPHRGKFEAGVNPSGVTRERIQHQPARARLRIDVPLPLLERYVTICTFDRAGSLRPRHPKSPEIQQTGHNVKNYAFWD
jgi:hypothetical protein